MAFNLGLEETLEIYTLDKKWLKSRTTVTKQQHPVSYLVSHSHQERDSATYIR